MLRKSFETLDLNIQQENQLKYLWGTEYEIDAEEKTEISQSHIIIDNLSLAKGSVYVIDERDSVHIDAKTNLAINQHKFDYELIEPGVSFQLNAEITLREGFDTDLFRQFICFISNIGMNSGYQQGSFKNSGFGIISFSNVEVFEFAFPDKDTKWFDFLEGKYKPKNEINSYKLSLLLKPKKVLRIEGEFQLKSSLIIRADSIDTINEEQSAPDKVHLTRAEKSLLTGKTLKGVVRHRASKILKTKGLNDSVIINDLFGFVDKSYQFASRVKSFETEFENAELNQVQPRVKIDRYTGGTIEGAFMQSKPVWHKDEKIILAFEICNCAEADAGLLLLVMKDLMNEDLPIGGEKSIGRGVLAGKTLKVEGYVDDLIVSVNFDNNGISNKDDTIGRTLVNDWVTSIK